MVQPANKNMLPNNGFVFTMKRLPATTFFLVTANIPGLAGTPVLSATPFNPTFRGYDKLTYADFSLTFKVDEDMQNWAEIANWMIGIGFPQSYDQRAMLELKTNSGEGIFSDGTLTILSSASNPNIVVNFVDMFPTSLSDIQVGTNMVDLDYLEATVTFRYGYHTLSRL